MKERPILMNADMVRAILEGRKTQTRRPAKVGNDNRFGIGKGIVMNIRDDRAPMYCLLGQPGDRLWVRETWQEFFDDEIMPLRPRGPRGRLGSPSTPDRLSYVFYRADGPLPVQPPLGRSNWRPSIHMPRWACRIILEITDVRVERLWDISIDDAREEGVTEYLSEFTDGQTGAAADVWRNRTSVENFRFLWDAIYWRGEYAWIDNPWVWVVEFKRIVA